MHGFNKSFGPFWAAMGDCGPQHQHRPGPWGNPWERGSHHRGGGPGGPPPWLAGLLGMGRPEGTRGARVRRGDVRSAILDVLHAAQQRDESINGYQVIQQITDKSGGAWRPSPGLGLPDHPAARGRGSRRDRRRARPAFAAADAGGCDVLRRER